MESPHIRLVLPNIRSLYNVGSFFRTADATGVEKIYCCGTTGTPQNKRLWKVSLGAEQTVPWEYAPEPGPVLEQLRRQSYQIIAVEKNQDSVVYTEPTYSNKIALIFGAETSGVEQELLQAAELVVHLPMHGQKHSLNVAVAGGVILYYLTTEVVAGKY